MGRKENLKKAKEDYKNIMKEISSSKERWKEFLEFSSRFYKYSFTENLLMFSNNPNVTMCATLEEWASELGLANDMEAFQATKQAVYSVLYGFDPQTRYRGADQGADERGDAIKRAIVNIVNAGRYGSEQPSDPSITLSNSGGLYEDGNYYTQKINVSSKVQMANYTITATANLPEGTIITNGNGTQTNNFNGNESLFVKIPKSQMNKDISNAIINVQGKCKVYPVFYGRTRQSNTQNYALTYDPFGDGVGRTTLNLKTNTGKVAVLKTDNQTQQAIEGVTFSLKREDGSVVETKTTGKDGKITFENLYQGNYKLVEVGTNPDYVLNKQETNLYVEYNKTSSITIENEHKKGNIKVYKVDKDNHKVVLGNVQFDLYSHEFGKVIGTYTTDVNGEIKIDNLRTGDYSLIEKNTNKWYNLAENQDIKVEWNLTKKLQIENELKKGKIRVIKVDLDNNEIKIPNVEFEVVDKNGNVLETIKTDKDGIAQTKGYPIRDYEQLTLRETKTDKWYTLNNEKINVDIKENQVVDVTIKNELKKGQIRVIKVDLDNNEVKLKNVEFDVLDEKGNVVDKLKTDENGEAVTKRLPINQKYTLKETKTQQDYVLNEEMKTITLTENQITDVVFTNELKKGQIRVIKVDLDNNEVKLKDVEFNVLDEKENVVDILKTDENGEAVSKRLPINQKYTLKETKTLEEYVLNEEIKTITLTQDQITDIQFTNEKIKGYIQVTKTSSEDNKYSKLTKGSPLPDVSFEVYDSGNNLVDTIKTNGKGVAVTKELLKGKYTIKEISSAKYYLLNEKIYNAEIVNDQEIVNVDITNDNVDIDVEVNKTGFIETQSKDDVYYNFKNIKNKSNVALDEFSWYDTLPTDAVRINRLYTGTWNEDLQYDVYYKTNKSDEYILFKKDLNTQKIYELNFNELQLQDDEYVTEYEFRFGKVKIGFQEVENPILYCDILEGLGNGYVFTNHTRVKGKYFEEEVEDKDDWTTITYQKKIKVDNVLPRTRNID